jgi:hypothetical protein
MAKDKDGEPKFFVGTDERCKDTFLVDCCGSGDNTADNINNFNSVANIVKEIEEKR